MDKLYVLYYSGVGNTKRVAEQIAGKISAEGDPVELYSVEQLPSACGWSACRGLVIGFPTIHGAPAKPVLDFLTRMPGLKKAAPAFLFTTCGLYCANALRIFAKACIRKNIIPVQNKSYRCAATDGMLLAPAMKIWDRNEKNLPEKLSRDTARFLELIREPAPVKAVVPPIKWYSLLNYPNKVLGQSHTFRIYLHRTSCTRCGKCVLHCPVRAIGLDEKKYPCVDTARCINCYRCIHHCPDRALSLSRKKRPAKTLLP